MGRLGKIKRQAILEANMRVLNEQGGELTAQEIMDTTRNPENMTLIGPDGEEVKVTRYHIDGNEVIFGADTTLIDKNRNTEFKLTFGGNTYTGSFHPTEKEIIMDIPNSKYMVKIHLHENLNEQTAYERQLDRKYSSPKGISIDDAKDNFCSQLEELCEKHGWSCDCEEVIKVLEPKSIEDNPFGI